MSALSHYPSAGTVTRAIHWITWRIWFNDISRSLGSRTRARLVLWVLGVAMVAWTVYSGLALGRQLGLDTDTAREISTPVAGVVFTLPGLATLMACLYAPNRTVLTEMLSVLPVHPAHVKSSLRWLTVIVGTVAGVLMGAPLILQFIVSGDPLTAVAGTGFAFYLAVLGALFVHILLSTFRTAISWSVRSDGVMVQGIAGLLVAALMVYSFFRALPFNYQEPAGPLAILGNVLAWLLGGPRPSAMVLVLVAAAPGVLLLLSHMLDRVPEPRENNRAQSRTFATASGMLGNSLLALEIKQHLRFPANAVLLLFINGLAIAAIVVTWIAGGDEYGATYLVLTIVSAFGIGAYGPTRRHHWVYRVTGAPHAWILPKFLSVTVIWAVMILIYGTALVLWSGWYFIDLVAALPVLFIEMAAGCLIGLLLPVSREQSIGGAVSEAVALVGLIGLTFAVQTLIAVAGDVLLGLALQLAIAALLVAAYLLTARWLSGNQDVTG
ncbi:hypothetical protein [Arthrobacter sp. CAN_A1]|uniref:hypothetical protein n=1 Tax=Arthrobacter sp. CAN_A1 TaxID=2787717 RepID=UPI0018C9CB54